MKTLAAVVLLAFVLLIRANTSFAQTHFGVLVNRTENKSMPDAVQIKLAKELGIQYLRTRIIMSKMDREG
jgi:hypothetical protein